MAASALTSSAVSISRMRLLQRLEDLGAVGSTGDGGCCRLALTNEDRHGRDLLITWMRDLGLDIDVDAIGNITGTWKVGAGAPVMTGSHIDTVRTGGLYDGNLGVIAGLEVIETLMSHGLTPPRPLAVTAFTNEEGARFQPDMLGSLVYVGGLDLETALDTVAIDGARLGDELARIGYQGATPVPAPAPHAFVELHIEQGPVLEQRDVRIGAVTGVQGISWQEVTIHGQSNHAGTTPMSLRHDPAYVAAAITVFLRRLADELGGHQVCTVGKIDVFPNLINVVPARVMMTLDVRNTEEETLKVAESRISEYLDSLARDEGVRIERRTLARFEPVVFCPDVIDIVDNSARLLGSSTMRLPSGAGHDAQMLARNCPTAMIFTPSVKGISHNPAEHTAPDDLELGTNVLLHTMWELAHRESFDFIPGSGT